MRPKSAFPRYARYAWLPEIKAFLTFHLFQAEISSHNYFFIAMDTSEYPSLPNLARMHARLAADSRKVERIVDLQLDVIERLFHASTLEDWQAVANASRQLAGASADNLSPEVVQHARQVWEELNAHPAGGLQQSKHLARLLAACREVRARGRK